MKPAMYWLMTHHKEPAQLTHATATVTHNESGIWSALIEWPFGYRFVSAIDLTGLTARIDAIAWMIGRRVDVVRG